MACRNMAPIRAGPRQARGRLPPKAPRVTRSSRIYYPRESRLASPAAPRWCFNSLSRLSSSRVRSRTSSESSAAANKRLQCVPVHCGPGLPRSPAARPRISLANRVGIVVQLQIRGRAQRSVLLGETRFSLSASSSAAPAGGRTGAGPTASTSPICRSTGSPSRSRQVGQRRSEFARQFPGKPAAPAQTACDLRLSTGRVEAPCRARARPGPGRFRAAAAAATGP